MDETLALCETCGTPYAAFFDDDDELQVRGDSTCPSCGGTKLIEVSADDIENQRSDENAPP